MRLCEGRGGEEDPCPVGACYVLTNILTLEETRDQCNKPRSIQEFHRVGLLLRRRPHRKPSTEAEADGELWNQKPEDFF